MKKKVSQKRLEKLKASGLQPSDAEKSKEEEDEDEEKPRDKDLV